MPSSQLKQIEQLLELILFTDPKSILDIGVGFGKYGFLAREYLELWGDNKEYNHWSRRIDGVEAYSKYLTPVHSFVYDNIYIGNALEVLPKLQITYDLLLLIDVLEHFTYTEGATLLESCLRKGCNVIVSTPKAIGIQGSLLGNPFEEHKFQWRKRNFVAISPSCCFIPNEYSIICYFGKKTERLKRARFNRIIGQLVPFIVSIVRNCRNRRDQKGKS